MARAILDAAIPFLGYWWRGDGDMIMQLTTGDPISNSFHFIIYILWGEGGGCPRAIPDAAMPFFRLLVDGGDDIIMQIRNGDPISNSFCFIIYILQGGGGTLEPSLM